MNIEQREGITDRITRLVGQPLFPPIHDSQALARECERYAQVVRFLDLLDENHIPCPETITVNGVPYRF